MCELSLSAYHFAYIYFKIFNQLRQSEIDKI